MVINTRPLEFINSMMLTVMTVGMSLAWPVGMAIVGLMIAQESMLFGLGWVCCLSLPAPFLGALLQVTLRWTRRGSGHLFLEEVNQALGGDGTVTAGTLLLPLLAPRLEGTLDGRAYSVLLRRTGGFLSSSTPGAGLLPWRMELHVEGKVPHKVGFMKEGSATLGISLLGLSNPQPREGVLVLAGADEAIADNEEALTVAREMTADGTTLVILGSDGYRAGARMVGTTAQQLAEQLRQGRSLLAAVEA